MQATANITFEDCGRRFYLRNYQYDGSHISGRLQNWLDTDGSVSGFGEPTVLASGQPEAGLWWQVDNDVVDDPQGPLKFFKLGTGPERGLGHFHLEWDSNLHNDGSQCTNGRRDPCDTIGYIKHFGSFYSSDPGLPIKSKVDVVGPVGGFGWFFDLFYGAPQHMIFSAIEVGPDTPMLFSMLYPVGSTVTVKSVAAYCNPDHGTYFCNHTYHSVNSIEEVRESNGNAYHLDSLTGLLTIRIIQTAQNFLGFVSDNVFIKPDYDTIGKWGNGYALGRYERNGVRLPQQAYGPYLEITASCFPNDGTYCTGTRQTINMDVCDPGYNQVAYDKCCDDNGDCYYANGDFDR